MNVFSKKADELQAKLDEANKNLEAVTGERDQLQAKVDELTPKVTNLETALEAKDEEIKDLQGKLEAASKGVETIPEKIETAAEDKAVEIAADAGIPPVTGVIKGEAEVAPTNAAEYIAAYSKLEGAQADAYEAKYRAKIFGV